MLFLFFNVKIHRAFEYHLNLCTFCHNYELQDIFVGILYVRLRDITDFVAHLVHKVGISCHIFGTIFFNFECLNNQSKGGYFFL